MVHSGYHPLTHRLLRIVFVDDAQWISSSYASSIKNWLRIANHNKANEIITKSYDHALAQNMSWPIEIKNALSNIGMMESFINPGDDDNLHTKAFQRMCDIFHQEAFEYLRKEDSKLRTYSHIKSQTGLEPYLHEIKNIKDRVSFTKLRLSNHQLMIEKGRHQKINKNMCVCPFCINKIEDELHFLLECTSFVEHRTEFFQNISNVNILYLNKIDKFVTLMTNINVIPQTAQYITQTMHAREYILRKHKNNS